MALNLPSRQQFESWCPSDVANFLSQNGMRECSLTVQRMKINGHWLLNLTESDLIRFNFLLQPQLQKMVHDIKKNDGSIMNKFKKFQNEQVALLRKTGKHTWDRLTNKPPPPSVPTRDYPDDEEQQWSDSEFDSDYENPDDPSETYEAPQEDNNYEPPPKEGKPKPNRTPALDLSKGEYLDNRAPTNKPRPSKPSQPITPQKGLKPARPMKPHNPVQDDEYVCPKDDEDDDNYIDPSEKSAATGVQYKSTAPPIINRVLKPHMTRHPVPSPDNQEVYEVPDSEEMPPPPARTKVLPPPKLNLRPSQKDAPPSASPRPPIKPPSSEPIDEDEYEVCDPDTGDGSSKHEAQPFPSPKQPTPLPREVHTPLPPVKPKPSAMNMDAKAARPIPQKRSVMNTPADPSPAEAARAKPPFKLKTSPSHAKLPTVANRGTLSRNGPTSAEQDAGVYSKVWYASTSERKIAEEALVKSNKDGSFLVRKSSGQDVKQPYTLVVFYKKRVYNIPVRYIESSRQYALGREKSGEEHFSSVVDMIENHQRQPLVLIDSQNNTKDSTKLKYPVKV
ncbi:B-cell linker protein isoform X3 [Amia ocellicauda]|uniref:B-cell linker protein isoform X3 n=1 Tax=Amia ocellicauda TaxID=2972642 RepID=UPI00346404FB